jgi:hypothetical protein
MTPSQIKDAIAALRARETAEAKSLRETTDAIKALQTLCKHPSEHYQGHSHNDSLYRCADCGREDWR